MQTRRNFMSMAAAQTLLAADGSLPHFAPKAKRVIYLFMYGGPSQIELFDHKPRLEELHGTELPPSIRQGQRLTAMTATTTKSSMSVKPGRFTGQAEMVGMRISQSLHSRASKRARRPQSLPLASGTPHGIAGACRTVKVTHCGKRRN